MSGPDKSLLERLSALKGASSGVSLDRKSNALNVSFSGIEPAKPPSREDALAARLRSLRNTPEREEPPPPPSRQQAAEVTALSQRTTAARRGESVNLSPEPPSRGSRSDAPLQSGATPPAPDDVDPLLQTDDQTLEDLLNDEDFDPQQWRFDPKAESAKVNALLKELSTASPGRHAPDDSHEGGKSREPNDDDDESEGEEMSKEVEALLSQALDGAKLDALPGRAPNPPSPGGQGATAAENDGEPGFSLPSVPSGIAAVKVTGEDGNELSLPSVPLGAVQPEHAAGADFDNDIAARMAALSGLGGSSGGDMGLPSVPTFQPADRAVKRLTSNTGYTDEDAETWCTVCLEDATLQCLGCEDVYCARCWHEMHVGPAAAFDDRTHKAVQFVKPRKDQQRRVMLGAS